MWTYDDDPRDTPTSWGETAIHCVDTVAKHEAIRSRAVVESDGRQFVIDVYPGNLDD